MTALVFRCVNCGKQHRPTSTKWGDASREVGDLGWRILARETAEARATKPGLNCQDHAGKEA